MLGIYKLLAEVFLGVQKTQNPLIIIDYHIYSKEL